MARLAVPLARRFLRFARSVELLALFVNRRVLPRGSTSRGVVGASGDLTPLVYVAAALAGEDGLLGGAVQSIYCSHWLVACETYYWAALFAQSECDFSGES